MIDLEHLERLLLLLLRCSVCGLISNSIEDLLIEDCEIVVCRSCYKARSKNDLP